MQWQADTSSPEYFNNCSAEPTEAGNAMSLAGVSAAEIHQGWFDDTLPLYAATSPTIELLRLDGDWYDSTMTCLMHLFPLVAAAGLVIVDDYGMWEGCTRAVHRYLADNERPEGIRTTSSGVAYLVKT